MRTRTDRERHSYGAPTSEERARDPGASSAVSTRPNPGRARPGLYAVRRTHGARILRFTVPTLGCSDDRLRVMMPARRFSSSTQVLRPPHTGRSAVLASGCQRVGTSRFSSSVQFCTITICGSASAPVSAWPLLMIRNRPSGATS